MTFSKVLRFAIIVLSFQSCGRLMSKSDDPERIGNFLLLASQQAGPLFGFGQNIVDKHDFQIFGYLYQIGGKHRNLTEIVPSMLYGIRDDLSIFIAAPFTPTSKDGRHHAAGMNDLYAQLEYELIGKSTPTTYTQMTLIGALSIPTGSNKKTPPTGFGSPSFFLGFTLSYTTQWWSIWIQGASILTIPHHRTKFGNEFLYQSGIEWCFATRPGWIFALQVEGFGLYEQKEKVCGINNSNSGGNVFWIGPSLWVSSEKLIVQTGIAIPVAQKLFGKQNKDHYFLEIDIGYKFN
jgi:hypothetical protein